MPLSSLGGLSQITEEKFEENHEAAVYTHLKNKLLKQFPEVFKEDLTPDDRLNIEPVKITLKPGNEDVPMYNARVPIPTPLIWNRRQTKN